MIELGDQLRREVLAPLDHVARGFAQSPDRLRRPDRIKICEKRRRVWIREAADHEVDNPQDEPAKLIFLVRLSSHRPPASDSRANARPTWAHIFLQPAWETYPRSQR